MPPDPKQVARMLGANPEAVYERKVLLVRGPTGLYRLDTSRLGRAFVAFGAMVRIARIQKGFEQQQVAQAVRVDRALISTLEAGTHGKLRLSIPTIGNLTHVLDLTEPVTESYTAYVAEVYPEARALYYPDDPGPLGPRFGLPLAGAAERMTKRAERP